MLYTLHMQILQKEMIWMTCISINFVSSFLLVMKKTLGEHRSGESRHTMLGNFP